jgi:hypothetical protein
MKKINKKRDAIAERMAKDKTKLIEEFKKMPIVQIVCERAAVSRATYYRWLEDDPIFRDAANAAVNDGEAFISDKSEAQLLALIGEKHFGAIKHYLEHHSDRYSKGSGLGGRPDRKIRVIILHDHED